ncbi:MAG TPA: tetratricopeptide repeat protein [Burkholderiales bacterium]|nr:tetratricopeptide repeat protein [Burkholderiales bacterium]
MPLLIALSAVVQVCLIYHVYRTGRPAWWAFVILSVPVVGSLLYYALELLPSSGVAAVPLRGSDTASAQQALDKKLSALALCPSVSNKIAAAEEYLRLGAFGEAVELYESALTGPHASDPALLLALARAQLSQGGFAQAQATLDRLRQIDPRYRRDEASLLQARVLEGLDRTEEALAEYEEIALVWVGLEARYRYAMLLERMGYPIQANAAFRELLDHARRYRVNPGSERQWIELAQQRLHALQPQIAQ